MCLRFIVKSLLFVFNFIFVVVGLALIALGILAQFTFTDLQELEYLPIDIKYIVIGIIVLGSVVAVISFTGCCGTVCESKCLLVSYICFMVVLAAAKIYLTIFIRRNADMIHGELEVFLNNSFNNTETAQPEPIFHAAEHYFECCGTDGPDSYDGMYEGYLPPTCCRGMLDTCTVDNPTIEDCLCEKFDAYQRGCIATIWDFAEYILNFVGYGLIAVIGLEVLCAIIAVYVVSSIKRKKY